MRTSWLLLASLAGALAAGCSSYSPDLGNTPFFCGSDKPECPQGYTCMPQGSASVCVAPSVTLPDANPAGCTVIDQNLEPNDMIADAFDTTIETNRASIDFAGLSICPAGDKDIYAVQMNANDNIDVTVTDDLTGSPLDVLIETPSATLAEGSPVGANKLHAFVGAVPAGQYYVQVQAASANPMGTNTYSLQIVTCTTPMTPSSCPPPMSGSGA